MTLPYIASGWYWIVGGDTVNVYSGAVGDYVPIADASYVAWLAGGNMPTRIATAPELGEVLAHARVTPAPLDPAVLAGYQDTLAQALAKGANAQLMLYTLNAARAANGEQPIPQDKFAQFIKDNGLT